MGAGDASAVGGGSHRDTIRGAQLTTRTPAPRATERLRARVEELGEIGVARPSRRVGGRRRDLRAHEVREDDGALVRAAVSEVAAVPRTARHADVVTHAFLGASHDKGLAIADAIGLPYGSYRRLSSEAVPLVVASLWRRDIAASAVR